MLAGGRPALPAAKPVTKHVASAAKPRYVGSSTPSSSGIPRGPTATTGKRKRKRRQCCPEAMKTTDRILLWRRSSHRVVSLRTWSEIWLLPRRDERRGRRKLQQQQHLRDSAPRPRATHRRRRPLRSMMTRLSRRMMMCRRSKARPSLPTD